MTGDQLSASNMSVSCPSSLVWSRCGRGDGTTGGGALRQMDMGSLTCAYMWVRAVHTKGLGGGWGWAGTKLTNSSLYKNRKTEMTASVQGNKSKHTMNAISSELDKTKCLVVLMK